MKSKAHIVTRIFWPFCVAFIAIGCSPRVQFKEVFSLPKPIPAPVTTSTEVRANLKELYPQLDFDDPLVRRDFEPLYRENWGTLCYGEGDDGCGTGEAIFLGIVAGVATVVNTPKRQVWRDAKAVYKNLSKYPVASTEAGLYRLCLTPLTITMPTEFDSSATAVEQTQILPVTSISVFLADSWRCF